MDSLIQQELIDEMVKRIIQQDKFDPKIASRPPDKSTGKGERFAKLVGTQLFDAASTHHFMKGKYGSEANPLGKAVAERPALMYGSKAGMGLFLAWLANKMEKEGHPTAARGFTDAVTGGLGLVGMRNLSAGREKLAHRERAAKERAAGIRHYY